MNEHVTAPVLIEDRYSQYQLQEARRLGAAHLGARARALETHTGAARLLFIAAKLRGKAMKAQGRARLVVGRSRRRKWRCFGTTEHPAAAAA